MNTRTALLIAWAAFGPMHLAHSQAPFVRIADTHSFAPGTASHLSDIGLPAIRSSAADFTVIFRGSVSSSDSLYASSFGTSVVTPGLVAVVPGCPELFDGTTCFAHIDRGYPPSLGVDGTTYTFLASDPEISTDPGGILFAVRRDLLGTNVTRIASCGDPMPLSTDVFQSLGPAYWYSGYVFAGVGENQAGIYRRVSPGLTTLADRSTALPGLGKNLFSVDSLSARDGALAFIAATAPPFQQQGVYSMTAGAPLQPVALMDGLTPAGRRFSGFSTVVVRGDDAVFGAGYSGFVAAGGIFRAKLDGTHLELLVDSYTPVPGTTHNFGGPFFNAFDYENGVLVFTYLTGASPDDGLYQYASGVIKRLLGRGDLLDGKRVTEVSLGRQAFGHGRVVCHVRFEDASQGVYVTGTTPGAGSGPVLVPGSLFLSSSAGFSFRFEGVVGSCYVIQYATTLSPPNWTDLTNFTYTVPLVITDPSATTTGSRYYRSVPCTPTVTPRLRYRGQPGYLLAKDSDELDLNFYYDGGGFPVDIAVTVDGAAEDFLEGAVPQTTTLRPFEFWNVHIAAKDLDPLTRPPTGTLDTDHVYAARVHIAFTVQGESTPYEERDVYICRYLEAADADHQDKVLDFPHVAPGVVRRRPLTQVLGGLSLPNFIRISPGGTFLFPSGSSGFTYQHFGYPAVDTATVGFHAPDGTLLGDLTLRGEGWRESFYIDEPAFLDTLRRMCSSPGDPGWIQVFGAGLPEEDKLYYGSDINRQRLFDLTIGYLYNILGPYMAAGAISRASSRTSATIIIDRFYVDATHVTLTEAERLVDRWRVDGDWCNDPSIPPFFCVLSRVGLNRPIALSFLSYTPRHLPMDTTTLVLDPDNRGFMTGATPVEILALDALLRYNPAERSFRLSKALNQTRGCIDLYLDIIFDPQRVKCRPWDPERLSCLLANILAHQIGLQLGLVATSYYGTFFEIEIDYSKLPAGAPDVMHGLFGPDQFPVSRFGISSNAVSVALGSPWTTAQADDALRYFQLCAQTGVSFDALPMFAWGDHDSQYPHECTPLPSQHKKRADSPPKPLTAHPDKKKD